MKTHGRFFTTILALTLSFMAALPSPSPAQEVTRENVREIIKTPMTDSPLLVKMSHWRDSRPGQRYAFLIGFMSMLDLENEWQAANENPLSFKQSLVPSWMNALKTTIGLPEGEKGKLTMADAAGKEIVKKSHQ